jgi:phosphoglycolate phosphatase
VRGQVVGNMRENTGVAVRKLILFDIDGTLIRTGGAGVRAMTRAFEAICGVSDALERVEVAGRTDRLIMTDALALMGRSLDDDLLARFRELYSAFLREELRQPEVEHSGVTDARGVRGALPGVRSLLDHLEQERDDIDLALLTGNFRVSAEIKLAHYDLWRYFPWGAFADDALDRPDLLPVAINRYQSVTTRSIAPTNVIIVGDTPHDVTCARCGGAKVVAVATGNFDRAALSQCEPDVVFEDLRDTSAFMSLIDQWS